MNEIMNVTSKHLTREMMEKHGFVDNTDYPCLGTYLEYLGKAQYNLEIFDNIIDAWGDYKPHRINPMIQSNEKLNELSNQKVTAMLKKLVQAGIMERIERVDGTIEIDVAKYVPETRSIIEVKESIPNTVIEFRLLER